MEFNELSTLITEQFDSMTTNNLFRVAIPKSKLYELYLSSFAEGTNNIFIERTAHDCQHCRTFIRDVGNVVAIIDNKLVSVWDIEVPTDSIYHPVVAAMSELIHSSPISNIFLNREAVVSKPTNVQLLDDQSTRTWHHFSCVVPGAFVERDIATRLGKASASHDVFLRALTEFSVDTLDTVIDLIGSDVLYRGAEHREVLTLFRGMLLASEMELSTELFAWSNFRNRGARIRNSVIGSLLIDITDGKPIEQAVASFESKVAPTNYRRSSAVVTKGMVQKAMITINELGLEPALYRRHATSDDLSINNVLYADRSTSMSDRGGIESLLMGSVSESAPTHATDIPIDDFLSSVVPNVTSIEALLTNSLTNNLVSIIAPTHPDAPGILAWDNNFSWAYKGNVTDSMKERVKSSGGAIDGVLRFSIQWNEEKLEQDNDLDAHCITPYTEIMYNNRYCEKTSGSLDVDITQPAQDIAVENITWPDLSNMLDGTYDFFVHNYHGSNLSGFRAEIEMNGELHEYDYSQPIREDGNVYVATVTLTDGKFTIKHTIPTGESSKDVWSIPTEKWHTVSTIFTSPNHWNNPIGNLHHFFTLKGCSNPEPSTGLYNEFLSPSLRDHRKTFELLSSKLRVEPSADSLAGLGFSSTLRTSLTVRTTGAINRTYNVLF